MSGVDVGEWEFSAKATAYKAIGDRCRSARINQSILNGLLVYKLSDEQVKNIWVPFLQFAGTSGQMLVEDLVGSFYLVFPGPKFELPTKLQNIGKLKTSINVIKSVLVRYQDSICLAEKITSLIRLYCVGYVWENEQDHRKYWINASWIWWYFRWSWYSQTHSF